MINSFVELMESADSFFDLFNTYGFYIISAVFAAIWIKTKNIIALYVAICEATTSVLCELLIDESGLIIAAGQFIIYGATIVLCNRSKLIQCVYLFVLLIITYDYFAWTYYEKVGGELSISIVNISYYMYFIFLPFIYGLIIKGLFSSGGGKGYAHRLRDSVDGHDDINHNVLASNNSRFKRLFKKSYKGAI